MDSTGGSCAGRTRQDESGGKWGREQRDRE